MAGFFDFFKNQGSNNSSAGTNPVAAIDNQGVVKNQPYSGIGMPPSGGQPYSGIGSPSGGALPEAQPYSGIGSILSTNQPNTGFNPQATNPQPNTGINQSESTAQDEKKEAGQNQPPISQVSKN